jgi:ABC-type branched-subunit amino acid transport system ATPase component/branched-subunit amino acid ABC-type transport system permease component
VRDALQFAILGLGAGVAYALLGQGVVLIYRGSGLVNFAHGALGAVAAYFAFVTLYGHGWPLWAAIVVGILVAGLLGILFQALVLVRLKESAPIVRLIATLGFLVVVQGSIEKIYGTTFLAVPSVLPSRVFEVGSIALQEDRLILLGVAIAVTVSLWAFLRYTRLGLAISAGSESELGVAAVGWSPQKLAAVTWGLGGVLAGLAAVFLVPYSGLQVETLVLAVMVYALAAALLGGFSSFPLTLAGGLFLGIGQSLLLLYTPNIQEFLGVGTITGLGQALPFLVIAIILVVRGRGLPLRGDPAARLPNLGAGNVPWGLLLCSGVGVSLLLLLVFSDRWGLAIAITEIAAIFLLSIVVLTGFAGQVSLGQMAIGGIGAFTAAKLVSQAGWPFEAAFVVGVLAAVPIGLLFAVSALRTRGVNLAVVTLGLGFAVQQVVFSNQSWIGADISGGTPVGSVKLFGWKVDAITYPGRWALVCLVALGLLGVVVANLRRSRSGRRLIAVRTNERAAASLGISVFAAKSYAFAVAAAIAAVAGILVAFITTSVTYDAFDPLASVNAVSQAVIGGVGWASGSLFGGTFQNGSVGSIPASDWIHINGSWLPVIGGVALILVLIGHPNGIAEALSRQWAKLRARLRRRPPERMETLSVSPLPVAEPTVLEVRGLSVSFGAVKALDGVSLRVSPGQVVGLIGPNGAGKTTLIDAVTGFVKPTAGEVTLGGRSLTRTSAGERARLGLHRSFQSLELFEDISVFENLLVAAERATPLSPFTDLVWPGRHYLSASAVEAVRRFGLDDFLARKPPELPYGHRRLVALARTMASGPSVLLLDEPAAGLNASERQRLGKLIRMLASDDGRGVLLIEHDVDLVMSVCDYVVVLDFGHMIATGTPEDVRVDPAVIAAYLGEPAPLAEAVP